MEQLIATSTIDYLPILDNILKNGNLKEVHFWKTEDYQFEKSGSQQDLYQPRTDIYCHLSNFESFKDLIKPYEDKWSSLDETKIITLFDDFLGRTLKIFEGEPCFNMFYSHSIPFLNNLLSKESILSNIYGGFQILLEKIINFGVYGGLQFHEDFCMTILVKNQYFKNINIVEQLRQELVKFDCSNTKQKKSKILKTSFSQNQGIYARINFLIIMHDIVDLLQEQFYNFKQSILDEKINQIIKMLIIISKTQTSFSYEYDQNLLSTLDKHVQIRPLKFPINTEEVANKFQLVFESIQNYMQLFFRKDLNCHTALYLLEDYIDSYNNLFSRIFLYSQYQNLHTNRSIFEGVFTNLIKNELQLYINETKGINLDQISIDILNSIDNYMYSLIQNYLMESQLQIRNHELELSHYVMIIQNTYQMDDQFFGKDKMIIRNMTYFLNFHSKIRLIEQQIHNKLYQNIEYIWVFNGLVHLYHYEQINFNYATKSFPPIFTYWWNNDRQTPIQVKLNETQCELLYRAVRLQLKISFVKGMSKLLVLLEKKGILKSRFQSDEKTYEKRFKNFHSGINNFVYENYIQFKNEILQENEDDILQQIKEDFLSGGKIWKQVEQLNCLKPEQCKEIEKFNKSIIKISLLILNYKKLNQENRYDVKIECDSKFIFEVEIKKK